MSIILFGGDARPVTMDLRSYDIIPLRDGFTPGNVAEGGGVTASILKYTRSRGRIAIILFKGGKFRAYPGRKPKSIKVDGKKIPDWTFDQYVLLFHIPLTENHHPELELLF